MLKRLYIYVLATVLLALPSFLAKADADSTRVVFAGDAFLKPLQKRDSVLIADQMKYGFRLDNVKAGTALALPDLSQGIRDSVEVVEGWSLDTLKFRKKKEEMDIEGSIVITSFDEGSYDLPPIAVMRTLPDGQTDTLSCRYVFSQHVFIKRGASRTIPRPRCAILSRSGKFCRICLEYSCLPCSLYWQWRFI